MALFDLTDPDASAGYKNLKAAPAESDPVLFGRLEEASTRNLLFSPQTNKNGEYFAVGR